MGRLTPGLAALALALVLPARGAAQWVEPPGQGWFQLTLYHQDTDRQFAFDGDRREIFADGRAVTTALFLTAALGVAPGVDVWAQLPWQRLRFDDDAGDRERKGLGDPRLHVRVAPLSYLGLQVPLALRAGVKLQVAEVLPDAKIIPLGEGQRDWEAMIELGHSFWPRSEFLMGWVGYRWRERDDARERDFGDELFFLASAGGDLAFLGELAYKVTLEGLYGQTPEIEGVELGGRIPLQGRNLPAGPSLVLGWFAEFDVSGLGS